MTQEDHYESGNASAALEYLKVDRGYEHTAGFVYFHIEDKENCIDETKGRELADKIED